MSSYCCQHEEGLHLVLKRSDACQRQWEMRDLLSWGECQRVDDAGNEMKCPWPSTEVALPAVPESVWLTHLMDVMRVPCESLCAWPLVSDDSEARSVRTRNAETFSLISALSWSAPSRIKRLTHFCPNSLPLPITKQLCFSKHPVRVHNRLLRKEKEKRSLRILWTKIDGDAIESAFPSSLCLSVFSFYSTMLLCIKLLIKWI